MTTFHLLDSSFNTVVLRRALHIVLASLLALALSVMISTSHASDAMPHAVTPLTDTAVSVPEGTVSVAPSEHVVMYSLLDTIGQEFYLPNDLNKRTQQQLNWYVRNPAYLDRVFTRAQRYLPYIVDELRKRNMPMELALLPVVESAFDPFAYSHGRAAGLWQFIPGTGKTFGLKQDWWYDGRRDPVASTDAALDYLEHLHKRLNGDWLNAIAGYNSGEGRVRSAVRRNTKKGLPTTFWDLKLPRETRAYVPKLLAISHLVKNYWQYNVQLPFVSSSPYFQAVDTGGQIDLAIVAEMADIDVQEIYQLNSGFNRWATSPQGPHRLMVPIGVAHHVQQQLLELPSSQRVKWQRHKISGGDTLGTLAQKYGTTIRALKAANKLSGNTIRAGKHLLIPVSSKNAKAYSLSADMREKRILGSGSSKRYTVQSGDSFWSIAKAHGVGTRQLARWNGMAPGDTLSIGKQLVIKGGHTSASQSGGAAAVGPAGTQRKIRYTVRNGDSLSRISSRFRVSVAQLKKWNGLAGKKYLQPGQKLNVFIDVTRQSGS